MQTAFLRKNSSYPKTNYKMRQIFNFHEYQIPNWLCKYNPSFWGWGKYFDGSFTLIKWHNTHTFHSVFNCFAKQSGKDMSVWGSSDKQQNGALFFQNKVGLHIWLWDSTKVIWPVTSNLSSQHIPIAPAQREAEHCYGPLMYSEKDHCLKACLQGSVWPLLASIWHGCEQHVGLPQDLPFPETGPANSSGNIAGCYHSTENSTRVNIVALIRDTIWSFHSWARLMGGGVHHLWHSVWEQNKGEDTFINEGYEYAIIHMSQKCRDCHSQAEQFDKPQL